MGKRFIRALNLPTDDATAAYSSGGGYGTGSELVYGLWKAYGIKVRPMKLSLSCLSMRLLCQLFSVG